MMRLTAVLLSFTLLVPAAIAADKDHHHGDANAPSAGEVRKVDKDAKRITIKHGPLPSLEMPAMTMVYRVKDPAMLEQVKAGDKVTFSAEKLAGALTVTKIDKAK